MSTRFSSVPHGMKSAVTAFLGLQTAFLLLIILLNQAFNVGATACFAASGHADRWRIFIFWQIVGGFFGLGVQLSFAGIVRYWSVTGANVVGVGLAFLSVQLFAAYLIFHESFAAPQWLGTAFVFVGVVLVAAGHR
jgi:drug/metabolite transporter (DMT)-like permease